MAWDLTIGGDSKKSSIDQNEPCTITLESRERSTMRFTTLWTANYVPALDAEVVAYAQDGTTKIFGGIVRDRMVEAVGTSKRRAIVECDDWWVYLDWTLVTLSYDEPVTMKEILEDLVDALPAGYGFTVDGSQADGPTFASYSTGRNARASDVLRNLAKDTEYAYDPTISPDKVIALATPGSTSAPYTMTDAGPNCRSAKWRDSDKTPANHIVLTCGPDAALEVTQTWTANGSDTSWVTDIPAALGVADPGYVTVGGLFRTVGTGASYTWDAATSTLSVGTDSTPSNGTSIVLVYVAQFPFDVVATSGDTPARMAAYRAEDITVYAQGVARADGLLASLDQSPRELFDVESLQHGWRPGQQLTVDLSLLDFDGTCIIGSVTIELESDGWWVYRFSALESTVQQGSRADRWRELLGVSASSSATSIAGSAGVGSSTVLSSPFPLGGARTASVPMGGSPAYTPVLNWVPFYAQASFTGRVRVDLRARNSGVGVTARLWNVTDSASAGNSSQVVDTSETETTFLVPIVSGKAYRLEVVSDTANEGAYAIGQLENVA